MSNHDLIKQIEQYLSHIAVRNSTDRLNMCADVYYMLKNSEDAHLGFSYFLKNFDSIDSDRTSDVTPRYTKDDLAQLEKQLGELTDAIFERIVKANLHEDQFYQEIWKTVTQSYVFSDDKSIIFAIYYIAIDARIPYFYIPTGSEMSDNKFKHITKNIHKDIEKVRFILNADQFGQWTMQASALLDVLDTKQNEERIVLMAHILKLLDMANNAENLSNPALAEKVLHALRQRFPQS